MIQLFCFKEKTKRVSHTCWLFSSLVCPQEERKGGKRGGSTTHTTNSTPDELTRREAPLHHHHPAAVPGTRPSTPAGPQGNTSPSEQAMPSCLHQPLKMLRDNFAPFLQAMGPWASHLNSMSLNFLICKMGLKCHLVSYGRCGNLPREM